MALSAANAATRGLQGDVVHRAGVAAAGLVDQRGRIVGEQGVGPPGKRAVTPEVAAGLLAGHGRHGVAQPDPLIERGEDAEFHPPPHGGRQVRYIGRHRRPEAH